MSIPQTIRFAVTAQQMTGSLPALKWNRITMRFSNILPESKNSVERSVNFCVGTKPAAWDIPCTTNCAAKGSTASFWLPAP